MVPVSVEIEAKATAVLADPITIRGHHDPVEVVDHLDRHPTGADPRAVADWGEGGDDPVVGHGAEAVELDDLDGDGV